MIWKVLIGLAIVYMLWRLWQGPKRRYPPLRVRSTEESAACDLLGVPDRADAETIRAAHRRLIAAVHPDRGGSAELTRQVNAARDLLLSRLHQR